MIGVRDSSKTGRSRSIGVRESMTTTMKTTTMDGSIYGCCGPNTVFFSTSLWPPCDSLRSDGIVLVRIVMVNW